MLGNRKGIKAVLLLALGTAPAVAQEPVAATPPPLTASDYLAPRTRVHLGPLSFYSVDLSGSMSNRPVGRNLNDFAFSAGFPETKSFLGRGSISMGMNKRYSGGSVSFRYTPTFDYQSSFDYHQVNHSAGLTLDREFRPSGWRVSLGLHGGTSNQFSTLLQEEPQIQPVLRLNVPITNLDLLNIISEPVVLTEPRQEMLLTGRRLATANAGLNISKRVSSRGSLGVGFTYGLNRSLEEETVQGFAFTNYKSNAFSSRVSYTHRITPRQTVGIHLADGRNYFQGGHGQQQSVSLSYSAAVGRKWAFDMSGGPGLQRARRVFTTGATPVNSGFQPSAVGSFFLSRATRQSVLRVGYTRNFYTGGLAGGQQTENVIASFAPIPRGYRWRVSLNGGYNWIRDVDGRLQSEGWMIRPAFQYPLTRTLVLSIQYAYFQQRFGAGSAYSSLREFDRYVASISLRWILTRGREASP